MLEPPPLQAIRRKTSGRKAKRSRFKERKPSGAY
jgi:hypothetical protein